MASLASLNTVSEIGARVSAHHRDMAEIGPTHFYKEVHI